MDKLLGLTKKLTDLSTITSDDDKGIREYKVDQGSAFAISLKRNDEVSVAQSFLSAGTIFPYHNHSKSNEVLVVYKGIVNFVSDNEKRTLNIGDSVRVCMGCGHLLHALTDVKIIAITIPPDDVALPTINKYGRK